MGIKQVRELLGIPPTPFANNPNDMVFHFLVHLKEDRYAEYTPRDRWEITEKGIKFIEEGRKHINEH